MEISHIISIYPECAIEGHLRLTTLAIFQNLSKYDDLLVSNGWTILKYLLEVLILNAPKSWNYAVKCTLFSARTFNLSHYAINNCLLLVHVLEDLKLSSLTTAKTIIVR